MMEKKGLVAMLDGMLAYTVAFISIGFIVLLMTNTGEADVKSTYALNVWAEDIADAICEGVNWKVIDTDIPAELEASDNLANSLAEIAEKKGIYIEIDVEGQFLGTIQNYYGDPNDIGETAVASRYLIDGSTVSVLTVKVGI